MVAYRFPQADRETKIMVYGQTEVQPAIYTRPQDRMGATIIPRGRGRGHCRRRHQRAHGVFLFSRMVKHQEITCTSSQAVTDSTVSAADDPCPPNARNSNGSTPLAGWGVLRRTKPVNDELIYAALRHGLSPWRSMRSESLSRYYIQVALSENGRRLERLTVFLGGA